MDLTQAIATHVAIQDFFILLTGSEYQIGWPSLVLTTHQICTMYFRWTRGEAKPPSAHECITSLPLLQECLGAIFFKWKNKREELGPGFYLYLATRRAEHLYEEHRLTSLVSGLETLHRTLLNDPRSATVEARIARILNGIDDLEDRDWLRRCTKSLSAPPLERRLREVLTPVAFNIKPSKLAAFCTLCAGIRNDLFHHGRSQKADASENPLQFLSEVSSTLSYLYHARIMIEIGVPAAIVEKWLTDSSDSYRINWYMERVGLRKPVASKDSHGRSPEAPAIANRPARAP